ncbi:MAG: response regulator [Gemmatimonadaceae bacterium]
MGAHERRAGVQLMKFLVVDDAATMRRIVINSLQRIQSPMIGSVEICEAEDGVQALGIFRAGGIDFVLSDWNMPNMTGLELARAIRELPTGGDVPILMVTTRASQEDILAAVQARVNNYVLKPFTPQVLKEKIELVLSQRSAAAA